MKNIENIYFNDLYKIRNDGWSCHYTHIFTGTYCYVFILIWTYIDPPPSLQWLSCKEFKSMQCVSSSFNHLARLKNYFDPFIMTRYALCRYIRNSFALAIGYWMGPIWVRHDPVGTHAGSMNFAIWGLNDISNTDTVPYPTIAPPPPTPSPSPPHPPHPHPHPHPPIPHTHTHPISKSFATKTTLSFPQRSEKQ